MLHWKVKDNILFRFKLRKWSTYVLMYVVSLLSANNNVLSIETKTEIVLLFWIKFETKLTFLFYNSNGQILIIKNK